MFKKLLGGLGDSNEKQLKRLQPIVEQINGLEPEMQKLTDDELRAKTDEFKARLKGGASLDELLPEAFAAVREAAQRTIGQRHYDVQLLGGIVLHQGKIAEMKTGEGKTLVATLPLYLNALTGKGCHLVTVNDYLARRDPYWMGPVYNALGMSVASIYPQQTDGEHTPALLYDPEHDSGDKRWPHFRPVPRREAYQADVVYGTCAEFGFDYLRDNMVVDLSRCVQGELSYAIVDEVDNLLIDEARTPLIISGQVEESLQEYHVFARIATRLKGEEDYEFDEKTRKATLTQNGISNTERMLRTQGLLKKDESLYGKKAEQEIPRHLHELIHKVENALSAEYGYKKDVDYHVTPDKKVLIVDTFTGRLMVGRRYSEGLHQAIEAKEHVKVQRESRTFATITIQNYFRSTGPNPLYDKLSGMTGTALTEAEEFHRIYNLEVVEIPTHKPMIRKDYPDRIYKDEKAKFKAVANEIEEYHKQGRPVLVGTVSIEKSERLSALLKKKGIKREILNAKEHVKEGDIIAQAGREGAVTVATNMAGRGVDIVLGGSRNGQGDGQWQKDHDRILELGGLHIVGTERHEARRIDNQLRGRAGRQGDPGSSRFYVSLEDDVVKRFGGDRFKGLMEWAGLDEDTPIESRIVNRTIEGSQVRVEGYHFDMRKHLVEYDDVVNQHRKIIYDERRKILEGADLKGNILSMIKEEIGDVVAAHIPDERGFDIDIDGMIADAATIFPLPADITADPLSQMRPKEIEDRLVQAAEAVYEEREQELGAQTTRTVERLVMLRIMDSLWVRHLTDMEQMRQGVGLMGVAQRDPLVVYKTQGHEQFQYLLGDIRHDVAHAIYHVRVEKKGAPPRPAPSPMAQVAPGGGTRANKTARVKGRKIGRNDPCPCGSGKKYKHCCGR
ncbi:Protein translocase subunit SecA [subsurface metagenome]